MSLQARVFAPLVLSGSMTGFLFAQAPAPPPQGQTPGGRGGAPTGPRPDGYTQYTRPWAPEDVILRGKALYETNCASCHAPDLR
jgi:mono/diheme cytochrome c family protein